MTHSAIPSWEKLGPRTEGIQAGIDTPTEVMKKKWNYMQIPMNRMAVILARVAPVPQMNVTVEHHPCSHTAHIIRQDLTILKPDHATTMVIMEFQ